MKVESLDWLPVSKATAADDFPSQPACDLPDSKLTEGNVWISMYLDAAHEGRIQDVLHNHGSCEMRGRSWCKEAAKLAIVGSKTTTTDFE